MARIREMLQQEAGKQLSQEDVERKIMKKGMKTSKTKKG